MPKLFSVVLLSLMFVDPTMSQSFFMDEKIPAQVLEDTISITYINSRLGSCS